ncbi:4-amino-4-deoxy-L-arabinose transferase-like glycosyltransferase [Kribbella voronezhensis]|uniref:4-amino-4-deoxy-L-arabinose transferase-like glycosyltransferase n=1 Tax=Kribbella voronezhensis TaxID=2512212 RepID=A0A4R7TG87_9ACTN|nr:4-amino-4-deoxy-L-arabinose transferase-like glycosyltransferase [Kribbella voronezhensis]
MGSLGRDSLKPLLRVTPGLLIWATGCLLLAAYGTRWDTIGLFSLYLGLSIVMPGVLLWRWLRGNGDGFAADFAFGTGLGLALSILTYIPGRALGVPLLPLVVPAATLDAFLTVPVLRTNWRTRRAPMPAWWAWSVAAAAVVGLWVITRNGLAIEPIAFPDAAFQYSDMPYQLALAGELKNHLPGQIPYVIGQPLNYHWFMHAEVAATTWQTGIELDVLLRRLFPTLCALLPILSVAALATKLAKRSWAGPLAAWLLLTVTSFDVYGWDGRELISQAPYSTAVLMYSLTHAFAVVLAIPVVWLIVCLLREDRRPGNWLLLAVGIAALAGAKASFVPMLVAAIALVIAVQLATTRRLDRAHLGLAAVAVLALGVAQVVLFSAGSSGVALGPGQSFRALAPKVGFGNHYGNHAAEVAVLGTTGLTLLVSWAIGGVGMVAFLQKGRWKDPTAVFLLGFLIAGVAAGALLHHPGFSQLYFVRAAFPIAIAGSAWGLTQLLDSVRFRVALPRMAAALAVGAVLAKILGAATPDRPLKRQGVALVSLQVIAPWLTALLVAAIVTLLLTKTPGHWKVRPLALGLGVLVVFGVVGIALPETVITTVGEKVCVSGPERPDCRHPRRQIPDGGAEAARYIRDHSSVNDRLVTNSHCMPAYDPRRCDTRNFWLSAYAERRVLVEGWAYTPRAQTSKNATNGPFWDPELLALNDADPSPTTLDRLWTQYGVRWLVYDTKVSRPPHSLQSHWRFSAGTVQVFELTPPISPTPS